MKTIRIISLSWLNWKINLPAQAKSSWRKSNESLVLFTFPPLQNGIIITFFCVFSRHSENSKFNSLPQKSHFHKHTHQKKEFYLFKENRLGDFFQVQGTHQNHSEPIFVYIFQMTTFPPLVMYVLAPFQSSKKGLVFETTLFPYLFLQTLKWDSLGAILARNEPFLCILNYAEKMA